ncbi:MAG TPA: nucleotidyltransferase family protein [Candidatus Methanoperedens sp.]
MLTTKETINILKNELPYLNATFGVKRIGLFGSYSKGLQREDSDVDIIVEFEKPIGLKFVELADYLENILDKKVSLLTPEGIKSIRVKNVAEDIEKSTVYV